MRIMSCGRCAQRVFFENVECEGCGAALGFVPAELTLRAFDIQPDGNWLRLGPEGPAQRPCANRHLCNWMLPVDDPGALCVCCRTTAIIPALTTPENAHRWMLIERAKQRLFYGLLSLKLAVPSKGEDAQRGLSFQFLESTAPEQKVLTGHQDGVITLNIAEADDDERERMRNHLHEPYRTLLGHFRHEVGHYFWDRLIDGTPWLDEFRERFGDERADYAQALQQHYNAPKPDWLSSYVSSYASSHPWEDWAECWAHYLHIVDGLETASAWGLTLANAMPRSSGVPTSARPKPLDPALPLPTPLIEQWLPVSQFINAMDRCLGTHDSYPFVLVTPVIEKLEFIHRVIGEHSRAMPQVA